jgi:hypothetical protein
MMQTETPAAESIFLKKIDARYRWKVHRIP